MQPPNHRSRINLTELKAQLVKKLGPEGSKQYFFHLNRFLSSKSTKVEFNKLCLRILGRENLPLHNQLIRSILRNASTATVPPYKNDGLKHHDTEATGKEISAGYLPNGPHSGAIPASGSLGLSNGVILPLSPKKARISARDWKTVEKGTLAPQLHQSGNYNAVLENGHLNPPEARMGVYNDASASVHSKSSVQAPLGVPLCPVSIGGARRSGPTESSSSSFSDVSLPGSHHLRERMEQIAMAQGLEGVSLECANVLNHGLDSYMKGLIRSCIELVGGRSGPYSNTQKQHAQTKIINGFRYGHQYQPMQNSGMLQEQRIQSLISLQDFRTAMEMNPQQLGEDWPLLLEKICTHSFEE